MLQNPITRSRLLLAIIATATLAACSKSADVPRSRPPPRRPHRVAAPAPDNVKSFKIGELSAMALRDGGMDVPNDNKVFGRRSHAGGGRRGAERRRAA